MEDLTKDIHVARAMLAGAASKHPGDEALAPLRASLAVANLRRDMHTRLAGVRLTGEQIELLRDTLKVALDLGQEMRDE